MKIAYLISAHNTPAHLKRLVHTLNSPNADFFIHVDKKSDVRPFEEPLRLPNCVFLKNRTRVYWGEFSQVRATLDLMQAALNNDGFDYVSFVSGSDYPLRRPAYIERFLAERHGTQFLDIVEMPSIPLGKPMKRLELYKFQSLGTGWFSRKLSRVLDELTIKREWIRRDFGKRCKGLRPYGGSSWWTLTGEACGYVLKFVQERPEVLRFFENAINPDESFFQTVLGNSPYFPRIQPSLSYADWSMDGQSSPPLITMGHLQWLINRRRSEREHEFLFARKFSDENQALTEFIDREIMMG